MPDTGRIDEAGLKWPSLSTSPTASGGAGSFLKSLIGGAGSNPYLTAFNNLFDLGGKIGSIFTPDRSKQSASTLQQNVERTAMQIQDQVNSGQMDVDAGIAALTALQRQTAAMSGDQNMANGAQMASMTINQVMGNLQSRRNSQNSAPLSSGPLKGDASSQKAQVGTAMRNYFTGAGASGLEGSPIEALTKPVQSPFERLPQAQTSLNQVAPQVKLPELGAKKGLY